MNKITTLFLIFISINCFSQELYQLKVEVSGNMPSFDHIFEIRRINKDVKVYFLEYTGDYVLTKRDSLRYSELRYKNNRTPEDNQEMMNIINSSKIFTKECVIFSPNDRFIQISDSIINAKKQILNEIKNDKDRVIIDGIQLKVTVKHKDGIGYFYPIHNPDKTHYKLFRQFLNEAYKVFPKP